MKCLLCENTKIQKMETINKKDLIFLYKKIFQVHISYLVSQDIDFYKCPECSLGFFILQLQEMKSFITLYKSLIGIT